MSACHAVNVPQVNNGQVNGIDERGDEQPEWCIAYDVFGDSEISPREGEEYQVELPPLISKSEYCLFQRNTDEEESTLHNFQVGLPIPIIWIKDGAEKNNDDPLNDEWKSIEVINKIESPKVERIQEAQK
ncbi:hypothetical protein A2U01_0039489, partial [Trifolium medium]|nr:hypothetical protein [Trifolium medium]